MSATTADAAPLPQAGFRPPNIPLTTLGLALASFMQVLDLTIANVSLPTISGNLGGSANQATWVITSFAVSNAIALPLTGWLTRHFGERKLFIWATFLFVIASLLCGLASSMGLLVAARALQGFVAGPMYPITQALLISIYPAHKRGQAIALLAMVTVVAPIARPILGGYITDNYTWEWIFFINVPLGVFVIWEMTDKDPIVNLRLFRHRNFTAGTIAMVVAYAAFFRVGILVPLWLQRNLGFTPIWAGFATAPIGILPVILTPFVGRYAHKFDLRALASVAFIAMSLTSFARAGFNLDVDF